MKDNTFFNANSSIPGSLSSIGAVASLRFSQNQSKRWTGTIDSRQHLARNYDVIKFS